ncbi:MAG TPA: imidazoleglycerol-phosphate dehydratase [Fimbriimonadaceae bacterium]|nr:imidazoleglycerol-phosphate dehydratase [Fimbriimonadaceae bacterium]HRJ95437.1 imidazoleglycerol-phosphate dehydratase [Fimbriimonadaceae bacterium]
MSKGAPGVRFAQLDRETPETRVEVVLDLDGGTRQDVSTGIGFFDHLLMAMAFHGALDLGVTAEGNLEIDDLHTVQDVGLLLGRAIAQALEESDPIERFASNHMPVSEALVLVAVDLNGRGQAFVEIPFSRPRIGAMATETVREFFQAVAANSGATIHLRKIAGDNDHHVCEAVFKGFGRTLRDATRRNERRPGAPVSKGKL